MNIDSYINKKFGVEEDVFLKALKMSPSAEGYILGAISEVILENYLNDNGFITKRIKEKPKGSFDSKNPLARGDFYFTHPNFPKDSWLVIESKGLKSNSEFRGGDGREKAIRYFKNLINKDLKKIYENGQKSYLKTKEEWLKKNPGNSFPKFTWSKTSPGSDVSNIEGIWSSVDEMKNWFESIDDYYFSEDAYRNNEGAFSILQTHKPSTRTGPITGISQAAPLVDDFNILAVDTFFRTGVHSFVFANSKDLSHSPTSPEHLYQNYTIDTLIKDLKNDPIISFPWFKDIKALLSKRKMKYRTLDETQIDDR
tara:strand:- start:2178 stop:3110 length:933 start_codon:yes stop_codon:yes gene_type:complete